MRSAVDNLGSELANKMEILPEKSISSQITVYQG